MPDPSTTSIWTASLSSSVLAAFLTQGLTIWRESRITKREATYVALRLATIFEKSAREYAGMVGDMDDHVASNGNAGKMHHELNAAPLLPDEKERWRDLPVKLTGRVLGFGPQRDHAQRSVEQAQDVLDGEEAWAHLRAEGVKLGVKALNIGKDLRLAYNLPALTADWWTLFLYHGYSKLTDDQRGPLTEEFHVPLQ